MRCPMRNECAEEEGIIVGAQRSLLKEQAQVMLDLFAEDRGRAAVAMDEIREWANAQDQHDLRFRLNRRLAARS